MDLLQNWFLMALLTPTFWAVACLVDSCLVGQSIYRNPTEGAVVSMLFCLLPVLFVLFVFFGGKSDFSATATNLTTDQFPLSAALAGLAYAMHLIFYFRTLFRLNDVSGTETFMLLSVLVVPVFAWLLLGEVLPAHYYLAFIVAAGAVLLQCLPAIRSLGLPMIINLTVCMTAFSLAMVLQAHSLETKGFAVSTFVFNSTCFLAAVGILICNPALRARMASLCKNFPVILVTCEGLGILALLSSHRATQQGPSVSMVALLECLLPMIIIAISFMAVGLNRYAPVLSNDIQKTLVLQTKGLPAKLLASVLLLASVSTVLT